MNEPDNFLEAITQLSNKELGYILKNITDYAENKLMNFGFVPRSENDSATGDDFAQEAFKLAIVGKRNWFKSQHPDIAEFLRMVVFSLIRNHLKKLKKSPVYSEDTQAQDFQDNNNFLDEEYDSSSEVVLSDEDWNRLERAFIDDDDGYIFFTDWLNGVNPREMAENYQTDVTVVYEKIRKGKKIAKRLFTK